MIHPSALHLLATSKRLTPAIRRAVIIVVLSAMAAALPRRTDAQIAGVTSVVKSLVPSKLEMNGRGPRLDETVELACHNCYEPTLVTSFADALKRTGTRSVEIDFWDDHGRVRGARPGAWYVRHRGHGNYNNCGHPESAADLRACLEVVRSWVTQTPAVGPILVFLDKKQGWGGGRSPRDLDSLILQVVPREHIYAPADLQRAGPYGSLREAAAAGAWQTVDSLQNRVMFVLTGPNGRLHEYALARRDTALIFVAPDVAREREVDGVPPGFDARTAPAVLFYNYTSLRTRAYGIAKRARALLRMTRVWFPFELPVTEGQNTCKLINGGVNRIARYKLFDLPTGSCIRQRAAKDAIADPKQQA